VVFVGGLTAELEGEEMSVDAPGFSGGDRTSLDLPAPQEALLERLQATGKPVVFVNMSGSALSINWADKNIPAIIQACYPGDEGGRAVAALIAGDFSPSGRLPITFYKSVDQLPPFDDYDMIGRTYRYFTGDVLYPFGFGLSFTNFDYDSPRLSREVIRAGESVKVTVNVRNSGDRDGTEIVQLYVSRPGTGAPLRSLEGFRRVYIKAGNSTSVTFSLNPESLSTVDSSGHRIVTPGPADIWVGGGQPDSVVSTRVGAGAKLVLNIKGEKSIPAFTPIRGQS